MGDKGKKQKKKTTKKKVFQCKSTFLKTKEGRSKKMERKEEPPLTPTQSDTCIMKHIDKLPSLCNFRHPIPYMWRIELCFFFPFPSCSANCTGRTVTMDLSCCPGCSIALHLRSLAGIQQFWGSGGATPETGFATDAIRPGDLLHEHTEERKRECKAVETNTESIHKTLLSPHHHAGTHAPRTAPHHTTPLEYRCWVSQWEALENLISTLPNLGQG